ncbi:hypothetical protein Fmac_028919 [Flemingia macrophylla]|uniref:Spt5 KOW domain-containing protein n=1 Tax=Flemingia macrophylla TaxID=520843 RepID=A0ABD1L8V4_9FABA
MPKLRPELSVTTSIFLQVPQDSPKVHSRAPSVESCSSTCYIYSHGKSMIIVASATWKNARVSSNQEQHIIYHNSSRGDIGTSPISMEQACQGIPGIYVTCVAPVPNSEVCHLFTVRSISPEISDGMWVRIKGVMAVYNTRKKVTVKLVPRIDLQALAAKFFVELCFNPKIEEESQHHKSLYRVCTENNLVDAHPLPLPPRVSPPVPLSVTMLRQSIAMYHANENLPSVKGQWQKRKLIGRGTFGSVFHATNK